MAVTLTLDPEPGMLSFLSWRTGPPECAHHRSQAEPEEWRGIPPVKERGVVL